MIKDLTAFMVALRHRKPAPRPRVSIPGTVLGATREGEDVVLLVPTASEAHHVLVAGASGTGKTQLVASALVREYLALRQLPHPPSIVVIDPKGDLAEALVTELAYTAPALLGRVHPLDPFGPGFPLNLRHVPLGATPVEIRATQIAELVGLASTARGAQGGLGIGARQIDVLEHLILATLDSNEPHSSLLWALDALQMPNGFDVLATKTCSERARGFLTTTRLPEELRSSTAARLRAAFAATSALERMIGAAGAIDLQALIAEGEITVIDLGRPPGGLASLQAFFATLLGRLFLDLLLSRPSPWRGHHTRLVLDEAQIVVPVLHDAIERVLTTGRSRGVSLVLMSQNLAPIQRDAPELISIALTNVPLKLIGRVSGGDAEIFAREQAVPRGSEEPLLDFRRSTVAALTNLPNRVFLAFTAGRRMRFESLAQDMRARGLAVEREADSISMMRARHALTHVQPIVRLVAEVPAPTPPPRPTRRPHRPGSEFG